MKNRELFQRDPVTTPLANNGQARITDSLNDQAAEELRAELSTFVCEGQYQDGILRIVESYLGNLTSTNQPAAWVSGFYGSGKSHLLKMLCHLWVNTEFPRDGATARSLVPRLPDDVQAVLKELDTRGRQAGGIHAVSGTLPSGSAQSVRLAILGIILRSKGLPESYAQARFCLWLKSAGHYESVRRAIESAGKDFARAEQSTSAPSSPRRLLKARSDFAPDEAGPHAAQGDVPAADDISTGEFIATMREVLSVRGQIPARSSSSTRCSSTSTTARSRHPGRPGGRGDLQADGQPCPPRGRRPERALGQHGSAGQAKGPLHDPGRAAGRGCRDGRAQDPARQAARRRRARQVGARQVRRRDRAPTLQHQDRPSI